jgi:hypothetical protein
MAGGTKIQVGLANGDGLGTADDGVLDAEEVDQTSYVCTPHAAASVVSFTFTDTDDTTNTMSHTAIYDLMNDAKARGVNADDWFFLDIPGTHAEQGGVCFNNADWMVNRYIETYDAGSTAINLAFGDGADPDGSGTVYTSADGTTSLQVFAHLQTDYTWKVPSNTSYQASFHRSNERGSLIPLYCLAVPGSATDICLGVKPLNNLEVHADGDSLANLGGSATVNIKIGTNGASRLSVCGF